MSQKAELRQDNASSMGESKSNAKAGNGVGLGGMPGWRVVVSDRRERLCRGRTALQAYPAESKAPRHAWLACSPGRREGWGAVLRTRCLRTACSELASVVVPGAAPVVVVGVVVAGPAGEPAKPPAGKKVQREPE